MAGGLWSTSTASGWCHPIGCSPCTRTSPLVSLLKPVPLSGTPFPLPLPIQPGALPQVHGQPPPPSSQWPECLCECTPPQELSSHIQTRGGLQASALPLPEVTEPQRQQNLRAPEAGRGELCQPLLPQCPGYSRRAGIEPPSRPLPTPPWPHSSFPISTCCAQRCSR